MDILEHTNKQSATLMRDVFETLVGEEVAVLAHYAIAGKLMAYNGYILHVYTKEDDKHWYIKADSVEVISAKK